MSKITLYQGDCLEEMKKIPEIWKTWAEPFEYTLPHGGKRKIEGVYISNLGNIKGRNINKDRYGYYFFSYRQKNYWLHREVAKLFVDNPENKSEVDHINRVRDDCRASNLRWTTRKENANNPLTRKHLSEVNSGDNNPMRKKKISGSTGVAAVNLGRNFIGCELDKEYFQIAQKRINDRLEEIKNEKEVE